MTETMDRNQRHLLKKYAEPSKAPIRWSPKGEIEVFVHSQLSEPYGSRDSDGMDDVLSPANIEVARACRQVDESVNPESPESVKEGLLRVGKILLQTVTIVSPDTPIDTTGLLEIDPLKEP